MNELPSTWQRIAPHVLAGIGVALGFICAGIQNDPNWYQSLGIPSGSAAIITVVLAQIMGHLNERKSAKAMPPCPISPKGVQLTRCEQYVNLAMQAAHADGNTALVAHLNECPKPARAEQ